MEYLPEIDNIKFKYENSTNLYDIDIRINHTKDSMILSIHSYYGYQNPPVDKSVKISNNQFKELMNLIRILEDFDPRDNTTGLDGTNWYLEYSIDGKIKSYEFWSPELRVGTRDLKAFMDTCKKLLELANINHSLFID
jgi:hypothetical protein